MVGCLRRKKGRADSINFYNCKYKNYTCKHSNYNCKNSLIFCFSCSGVINCFILTSHRFCPHIWSAFCPLKLFFIFHSPPVRGFIYKVYVQKKIQQMFIFHCASQLLMLHNRCGPTPASLSLVFGQIEPIVN